MRTGVVKHPDWYLPLTNKSSFEDFQRHLHGVERLSRVCPEPCAAQARLLAQEACHTSVEGEPCYEKVKWVMEIGVVQNPDWYFPLTKYSSFEHFQRHLHGVDRLSNVCPRPCWDNWPETFQRQPRPVSRCGMIPAGLSSLGMESR